MLTPKHRALFAAAYATQLMRSAGDDPEPSPAESDPREAPVPQDSDPAPRPTGR